MYLSGAVFVFLDNSSHKKNIHFGLDQWLEPSSSHRCHSDLYQGEGGARGSFPGQFPQKQVSWGLGKIATDIQGILPFLSTKKHLENWPKTWRKYMESIMLFCFFFCFFFLAAWNGGGFREFHHWIETVLHHFPRLFFLKTADVNPRVVVRSSAIGYLMACFSYAFIYISHRIQGTGIFTYIYHAYQPNVGKYIIYTWILWVGDGHAM